MRTLSLVLITLLLAGCQGTGGATWWNPVSWFNQSGTSEAIAEADPTQAAVATALLPLSAVGGLCLITGVIRLLVSSWTKGWRSVMLGVGLCAMNAAILVLFDQLWFWIVAGITVLISAAIAFFDVKDVVKRANGHSKPDPIDSGESSS